MIMDIVTDTITLGIIMDTIILGMHIMKKDITR